MYWKTRMFKPANARVLLWSVVASGGVNSFLISSAFAAGQGPSTARWQTQSQPLPVSFRTDFLHPMNTAQMRSSLPRSVRYSSHLCFTSSSLMPSSMQRGYSDRGVMIRNNEDRRSDAFRASHRPSGPLTDFRLPMRNFRRFTRPISLASARLDNLTKVVIQCCL